MYNDFTGTVKWGISEFNVTKAELELKETDYGKNINFLNGTIEDGIIRKATICHCYFNGGKVEECEWYDGLFRKGCFSNSNWHNGTWNNYDCEWHESKWYGGYNNYGTYYEQHNPPKEWEFIR